MVYVATDLHGNYNLWEQIKNYLAEGDVLVYLGDAVDRGGRGFEVFTELLSDERVIYLRGNHEQMMYDAWFSRHQEAFPHWLKNGGGATLDNIKQSNKTTDEKNELIGQIKTLPFQVEYTNASGQRFQLTHAGYTPCEAWDKLEDHEKKYRLLWSRTHFFDTWPINNDIIVHGHTPIQYMLGKGVLTATDGGGVKLEYAGGHKICLDMGTYNSGAAILFNLDTCAVQKVFYDTNQSN